MFQHFPGETEKHQEKPQTQSIAGIRNVQVPNASETRYRCAMQRDINNTAKFLL
jgi:hypothetical protein